MRAALLIAALLTVGSTACGDDDGGIATERAALETTTTAAITTTDPPTTAPPSTVATTVPTTAAPATVLADRCPVPPPRRAPDPARPTYEITMHADPRSGLVEGTQTVWFTPDLPVNEVVFRLWANGPRPSSVGSSILVGTVTEGGAERSVAMPDPTTAIVRLDRTVPAGQTLLVSIPWRLQVNGPVNDRISRQGESLRLGSFVPLLAWEPGVGWALEPPTSGFAESTTSPTADWTLRITAPDGFGVVASGVERTPGTWTATAARDVAVAVGRFTTARATAMAPDPVEVAVAVADGIDRPDAYLGQVVQHLEVMASRYGPYPWPTFQLSITGELSGGIEYPMHVLQGPGTEGRTTPHEVAHMWFYGLVGNDQGRDPWLDEGLASYAEARLLGTLGSMQAKEIPADGRGHAGEPMTYWESRSSSYYRSVYVQPAATLGRLGDLDLVDCALAYYVAENAHRIATPEDLARALDATFVNWRPVLAPAGLP